jgi:chemotaxis family two-component system sensor kinase Cph1
VHVPVSEKTRPNPFLGHLPERDIQTPGGKSLTLMNPAYKIRQMMEFFAELYGMRGRITGLKHFSEATAPDDWGKSALMAFKIGNMDFLQPVVSDIKHTVRSIRQLVQKLQLSGHDQRGLTVIRLKAAEQGLVLTITAKA